MSTSGSAVPSADIDCSSRRSTRWASGPARIMTAIRRVLLMAVLAGLLTTVNVSPGSAEIYAGGGTFGAYVVPVPSCRAKLWANTLSSMTTAFPPAVWARDLRAGANNDAVWIRYRVYYINQSTGVTESSSSWSGWSLATDRTTAVWTGAPAVFSHTSRQPHIINYRIEYWDSTKMTAWVADRPTRYSYVDQYNVGPTSVTSC